MIKHNTAVEIIILTVFLFSPLSVSAGVVITEVMYDLEGTDSGREWIEILNDGAEIDISGFKFVDSANHLLNVPPKNGGRGDATLKPGEIAILAADASIFLTEHPGSSFDVIDTVMSLTNTNGSVSLIDAVGNLVDQVSYSKDNGAAGDGNSLHVVGRAVKAGAPSPGTQSTSAQDTSESEEPSQSSSSGSDEEVDEKPSSVFSVTAGENRTVMAGAESVYSAKVSGVSASRLRLPKHIWNFGDGDIQRGQTVLHTYYYPGNYAVHLTSYIGNEEDKDVIYVTAITSPVSISDVALGAAGYITLKNDSSADLDLSLWHLRAGERYWSIPKGTFILKKTELKLPVRRTGLAVAMGEKVSLVFPNGEIAAFFDSKEKSALPINNAPAHVNSDSNISQRASGRAELNSGDYGPKIELASALLAEPGIVEEAPEDNSDVAQNSARTELRGMLKWFIFLAGFLGLTIFFLFYFARKEEKKEEKGEYDPDEFEIEEELL